MSVDTYYTCMGCFLPIEDGETYRWRKADGQLFHPRCFQGVKHG